MADDGSLSAIILAGGQSRRMGQDKACMAIDSIPLLTRVYTVARDCAPVVYVVTPRREQYRALLPAECHFIDEVPLVDETESHGPLVGFAQGLAQVQSAWVLLLACDLPRLRAAILQEAIHRLPTLAEPTIALLSQDENGWQALCGFYRRQSLTSLKTYIDEGGRSFQGWLNHHPVELWQPGDRSIFFNCNTLEDFRELG